ncbi:MAG: hypothetical protein HYW70_02600 [Candidatus Nealsonbacteria bacterium]|nr:hypothetical protein [Candidatus Nealsonbacteria bacterium]
MGYSNDTVLSVCTILFLAGIVLGLIGGNVFYGDPLSKSDMRAGEEYAVLGISQDGGKTYLYLKNSNGSVESFWYAQGDLPLSLKVGDVISKNIQDKIRIVFPVSK